MSLKLIIVSALTLLALSSMCYAGLGKPLPVQESNGTADALKQARSVLEKKGYEPAQIDAAIAKLGSERISLLGQDAAQVQAGGYVWYFWDFLIFVLFVALIVWLILILIDANRGYYYRRRY